MDERASGSGGDRRQPERDRADALLQAQARARALFREVEQRGLIRAGVLESQVTGEIAQLAADEFGVTEHWHKRIVRAGVNTLRPYQDDPDDRMIDDVDIVFADFGPVFAAWEADFGRSWALGDDPRRRALVDDLPIVFAEGKKFFERHPDVSGAELYDEMVRSASGRGWTFGNWHCGHLVGEFPHEQLEGDKVESMICADNRLPLRRLDRSGRIGHWILEIHLVDEARGFGGFHEELLTL